MTASAPLASIPLASFPAALSSSPSPAIPITIMRSACWGLTTAGDVINRALRDILVQAADSSFEPDEYADALDALNDFMASLESLGLRLGYTRVCNIADIVTIPDGAIRGVAANLAIDLAPQYSGVVSPGLIKKAEEGMTAIRRMAVRTNKTQYPSNLPTGSGYNRVQGSNFYSGAFSRSSPQATLSMAINRRPTDITVAAGAEKAQGHWSIENAAGLQVDISGRITNTGPQVTLTLDASFTVIADSAVSQGVVGLSKNNVISLYEIEAFSTTPVTVAVAGTVTLEPGEFLEVVVADLLTTVDITLTDATVRLY